MTRLAGIPLTLADAEAFVAGGADALEADAALCAGLQRLENVKVVAAGPEAISKLDSDGLVRLDLAPQAAGRLLDAMPVPMLARFMSRARERSARVIFSGRLEPPDVPRLLPLAPDYIAISGPVSADQVKVFRALIPAETEIHAGHDLRILSARGIGPGSSQGETDRLIVRDFIFDMSVGAYAFEHLKPQRVKFDVVAEVYRRSAQPRDMRDIFSYDIIMDTIRTIVEEGHVDLLETLAEHVAQSLLVHPDIAEVHLKLEKLDLGPAIVGVDIKRKRPGGAANVKSIRRAEPA